MTPSRRDFLRGCGALVVSFRVSGQGMFGTHRSHIDPTKLDSWLAIGADGTITHPAIVVVH